MEIDFIDGDNLSKHIRKIISDNSSFHFAVAYWGAGSVEQFGLDKLSSTQSGTIICDLYSGACNPFEIRKLIGEKYKNLQVLTLDGLHAKVYWSPKCVIVGSSNASGNGMGFEEKEVAGLIEGNLKIDDGKTIGSIKIWLDKIAKRARAIEKGDIKKAIRVWKIQRAKRLVWNAETISLTDSLDKAPETLKDRGTQVWIYANSDPSLDVKQAIKNAKKEYRNSKIDGYEDEILPTIKSGAYIVDYPHSEVRGVSGKRTFGIPGIWKVVEIKKLKPKKYVTLVKPTTKIHGIKVKSSDLKTLKRKIDAYLDFLGSNIPVDYDDTITLEQLLAN